MRNLLMIVQQVAVLLLILFFVPLAVPESTVSTRASLSTRTEELTSS